MVEAKNISDIKLRTLRVTRLHFLYVLAIVAQIIMYDAWKVITPQVLLKRWFVAAGLLVVVTTVWLFTKRPTLTKNACRNLVYGLIVADIAVASFAIYTQRGMASRAVLLYIIPILTAAALRSRSAIIASTILSIAAYTTTAISYFVLNFNEGYKIELYGEVGFYAIMLGIIGALTWVIVRRSSAKES